MSFFQIGPPLRVKICGITNAADAEAALAAGADALGFNFYSESKRFLDFETVRPWISALAGRTPRIAVVVNPSSAQLATLRDSGCFEAIQFHGDESPAFCAAAGFPLWIRAARVKDTAALDTALRYDTPYLLLDSWTATAYGGTGKKLNWDIVREFVLANPDRKIILAGGLTPTNVSEAVRIARPHAADVAGGVELEPRRKNEHLIREFIQVARGA